MDKFMAVAASLPGVQASPSPYLPQDFVRVEAGLQQVGGAGPHCQGCACAMYEWYGLMGSCAVLCQQAAAQCCGGR
jgi:hypothetical protein